MSEDRLRALLRATFRVDDHAANAQVSPETWEAWMAGHRDEYEALVLAIGTDRSREIAREESTAAIERHWDRRQRLADEIAAHPEDYDDDD